MSVKGRSPFRGTLEAREREEMAKSWRRGLRRMSQSMSSSIIRAVVRFLFTILGGGLSVSFCIWEYSGSLCILFEYHEYS